MTPPSLAVVIPAYRSEVTVARCLEALQADGVPADVVVVDSAPDAASARVAEATPGARAVVAPTRLLPHAARNVGVRESAGELLLFTDPDTYAEPGALTALLAAQRDAGGAVAAALVCHGDRWLERGMHLAKFDLWLPRGTAREIEIAPTCGLLCARAAWERAGGFREDLMLGDTVFSWSLASVGVPIRLEPRSVFRHDHTGTWRGLLAERFARGRELGGIRRSAGSLSAARDLLVTVTLVRPVRVIWRSVSNAWRAGLRRDAVLTLPVVATGHLAWFAGEVAGLLGAAHGAKR
jgi:GT2 family glycosyltransferase